MPAGQRHLMLGRQPYQLIGFFAGHRQRLLDEHGLAGAKRPCAHFSMGDAGAGDGDHVHSLQEQPHL